MARDFHEVHPDTVDLLAELNCKHNVAVDIIVARMDQYERLCSATTPSCAPMHLYKQPEEANATGSVFAEHRVLRLARVRAAQRVWVKRKFPDVAAVVVVDLDLHRMSPARDIVAKAREAAQGGADVPSVRCALGVHRQQVSGMYYDTYATVLADGTFTYAEAWRLFPEARPPGEDWRHVMSVNWLGRFNQWDLTKLIRHQASEQQNGIAPMRSCFGGMAIFKAAAFFQEGCRYEDYSPAPPKDAVGEHSLFRYASKELGRPCEHVVFHLCLGKHGHTFGVDPTLRTKWKRNWPGMQREALWNTPDGPSLHGGNSNAEEFTNCLAAFRQHHGLHKASPDDPVRSTELENDEYVLRVDGAGYLNVEEKATGRVTWTPKLNRLPGGLQSNWYRVVLVLGPAGELTLYQQVPEPLVANEKLCHPVDDPGAGCRIVLWRLGARKHVTDRGFTVYSLVLRDDGTLELRERSDRLGPMVYWRSDSGAMWARPSGSARRGGIVRARRRGD